MKHNEGTFIGVRGYKNFYNSWLPEKEEKAILLVVHGLGEHGGRYMNVVNEFVPAGYGVYAIDHVGHGNSDGTRMFVNKFDDYTIPLKKFYDIVRKNHPEKPIFIVGHSLGGLISAIHLLKYQTDFAGAILSGPAIKISDDISPGIIAVGKILSNILPKVGILGVVVEDICRDPEVVQAYVDDPLVYKGKTTARLAAEMLKAIQVIGERGSEIKLPILILQGSEDKLVEPSGAQMLFDLVSSEDKKVKIYDGYYHDIFNEPEYKGVLNDAKEWIEAHL
jgi:acylglycerol lipase